MCFVYILECSDGTFYTGITYSWKKRLKEHQSGKGSIYTKSRLPVKLVYFEKLRNKHEGALREKVIKDMRQEKKVKLINSFIKIA